MSREPLLKITEAGLYCEAGDFHIDPWRGVDRAVITHGHADHARGGSRHYLASDAGRGVLRARLGEVSLETIPYGEPRMMNGVRVSLHPAGHLLGSAQVRVEYRGEVWVVSGDYKTEPDGTCAPMEPLRCHTFITESTFGLPIYRWRPQAEIFAEINNWWRSNQERGWTSVLLAYALGKAQRLLAGLDPGIGPILLHGSMTRLTEVYREAGVALPPTEYATVEQSKATKGRALVLAPPSAASSTWIRRFQPVSVAMASGWMAIRGTRRRRAMDRGFVMSDHADWPGLLETIRATGAEHIGVTHGYTGPMVRWLGEEGLDAFVLETRFTGEAGGDEDPTSDPGEGEAAES